MIDKIHFLIPNLDRRTDRWEHCHESLLSRGVPAENIERFPALDGLEYLDEKRNHANLEIVKAHMSSRFADNLPAFLENDRNVPLTHYAWSCTWYLGLLNITRRANLVCWILDDVMLEIGYRELLHYTQILYDVSEQRRHPLLAIQLARFPHSSNINRQPVSECPIFQFGYSGQDDYAFIYSPEGAVWTLDFANQRADTRARNSCLLTAKIRNLNPDLGFYGISPGTKPTPRSKGLISLCKGQLSLSSLHQYDCTDGNISQMELERTQTAV